MSLWISTSRRVTLRTMCRDPFHYAAAAVAMALASLTAAGASGLWAQTNRSGEPPLLSAGASLSTSRFQLFGSDDLASSGLRMTGDFRCATDNSGNIVTSSQVCNNFNPSPLFKPDWFDVFFYWAAPAGERDRHAQAVPSLGNARGKGYTVNSTLSQFAGELLPHDGSLGPFHSGVTDDDDGGCRDFLTLGPGTPLLAASDCPPTWGSLGWGGSRPVDEAGFLAFADLTGSADFSFDAFRVPENLRRADRYLGDFQTFGLFSDYGSETMFGSATTPSYGNVIPESRGGNPLEDATRSGWPLGLLARMDAFSFDAPGLRNTAWFQLTVTNNSREVYGVGLDYDSVYMGLLPGWLMWNGGGALYRDPANGVVRGGTYCTTEDCGGDREPMHPASSWGTLPPQGVGAGFHYGAGAIVILKSPIGDLRNKHLTDPWSPFFGSGSQEAWDDTITFNHGHMCGFHGCSAVTFNAPGSTSPNGDYEQRQFGMVASITRDVVGNRIEIDLSQHTTWDTWRWEEYPDRAQLDFNKWVPGGWDFDEDGTPDTLFYDDCSDNAGLQFDPATGLSKRCSVAWSDTLGSGFGNLYSNRAAVTGAGPFPLPADSSVQWVIAMILANDSSAVENDIVRAVDHYMSFYPVAEPPPPAGIVSVEVRGAESAGSDAPEAVVPPPAVTLHLDSRTEDWQDPYLAHYLRAFETAGRGTSFDVVRRLNPALMDSLLARVRGNIAALHIFKSCDGGLTFTADGDCGGDPTDGGRFATTGWSPWRTFHPNREGDLPNAVIDEAVEPGRAYLYALVTESRGFEHAIITGQPEPVVGGEGDTTWVCAADCRAETLRIAPPRMGALTTAIDSPQVVSVYIPVTRQSGATPAKIELITPSPDHVPFDRMNVRPAAQEVRDGEYTLSFADSTVVTEYSESDRTGTRVTRTRVEAFVGEPETRILETPGPIGVDGEFTESVDTLDGSAERVRVYRLRLPTALLTDADETPLMVASPLRGGQTVPGSFFGLPAYPGFTLSIDNSLAGFFKEQFYLDSGERLDSLDWPSPVHLPQRFPRNSVGGRFRIVWTDEAFGPGSPFEIDPADPEAAAAQFAASVTARAAGQTTSVDPDLAAVLGLDPGQLIAARVPFRVEEVTDSLDPRPLTLVLLNKRESIRLGSGADSVTVPVPAEEWVPGESLWLLAGEGSDARLLYRPFDIGCGPDRLERITCNPVTEASPGATGYRPTSEGQELRFSYYQRIGTSTSYTFRVESAVAGDRLLARPDRIRAALDSVRVVPNPFVLYSRYSGSPQEPVMLFTHVPPRGILRVFTIAGHFVQEIRWDPDDLNGQGDLRFDLVTREGNRMAAGLFLYVLTALDETGRTIGTAKGKFVLIR